MNVIGPWGLGLLALTRPAATDYVFVDEHNRHKRLKGKRCSMPPLPTMR